MAATDWAPLPEAPAAPDEASSASTLTPSAGPERRAADDAEVKSCDAIYEMEAAVRRRHRPAAWTSSSSSADYDYEAAAGAVKPSSSSSRSAGRRRHHSERRAAPSSSSDSRHGRHSHLLPHLLRWPFSRMQPQQQTPPSAAGRTGAEAPKRGSYQDLLELGGREEARAGVYRATGPGRAAGHVPAAAAASKERGGWFRRRKNGVDYGRLAMPINAGNEPSAPMTPRCRHPSDHSVSQPVPVAAGGKQRHRSCVAASPSPHSPHFVYPPFGCDVSGSSCASSVPEAKSRKSSGSSSSGGGGGGGNGGSGSSSGTGSRIRSFIDTFRPRAKSEHVAPSPVQLAAGTTPPGPPGRLCASCQSMECGGLDTIVQGQELASTPTAPPPEGPYRHERAPSGGVKRSRSPSLGSAFVERLRSLSSSSAPGQGLKGPQQAGAGSQKPLTKLPDPAKLPKVHASGSLIFTKMPLSPHRGGRARKVSYPPVTQDHRDIDVDISELARELRVSLPSSCPGPSHAFNHNNNLLKTYQQQHQHQHQHQQQPQSESMDTSDSADVIPRRRRTASSGTPPLAKEVQENSKYIIFRDKSESSLETQHIHWEPMSNVEDAYVQFMRRHTCYDLIPTSSKLVVFDTALIVRRAFFGLVYNGVRAAPLWDSKRQQFVGMLTITDFIRILRHYYRSSGIPIEELENQRIQQWRETIHDDKERPLIHVSPEDTLFNAVHQLVVHQVHRLPVIDPLTGNALHILTHKRILKYLSLYMKDIPQPKYMKRGIVELGIGTFKNVATVTADTSLLKVLNMFLDHRVSALPVVDKDNKLIDIYAKFDVINLAARQTYNNLEISVEEALSYRKDRFEGVASCKNTDTLEDVVKKIVQAGVHRLVMTDADQHVIGIVSLSDLLKFMVIEKSDLKPDCSNCPEAEAMETEGAAASSPQTTFVLTGDPSAAT